MAKRIIAHIVVILALLTLGAHFMYNYGLPVAGIAMLIASATIVIGNRVSITVLQVLLLVATVEWIRTAMLLADEYRAEGKDCTRMLIILGSVSVFTLLSAGMARWCVRESQPVVGSDSESAAD